MWELTQVKRLAIILLGLTSVFFYDLPIQSCISSMKLHKPHDKIHKLANKIIYFNIWSWRNGDIQ